MSRVTRSPEDLATVNDPRRVVLVTGCSEGGIGWNLATELERTGRYRVFATARSMEKMRTLPPSIERLTLDVKSQESVDEALEDVIREAGHIDIVINNAGLSSATGPAAETSLASIEETFQANFFGLIRVTQAALKHMIPRAQKDRSRAGSIVQIGSVAGYGGVPYSGAYGASKSAVHAWSDSLRQELAPWGIKVLIVAPGKIASGFGNAAISGVSAENLRYYAHVKDQIEARAMLSQTGSMKGDDMARGVVRHLERYGALGEPRRGLGRFFPSLSLFNRGEYLNIGPTATLLVFLYHAPTWFRDMLIYYSFKLRRIAQLPKTAK